MIITYEDAVEAVETLGGKVRRLRVPNNPYIWTILIDGLDENRMTFYDKFLKDIIENRELLMEDFRFSGPEFKKPLKLGKELQWVVEVLPDDLPLKEVEFEVYVVARRKKKKNDDS